MNDEDYKELFGMTKSELMHKGMMCLIENLGVIEAETYIANVMQEGRDHKNYEEWSEEYFGKMTDEEFRADLQEYIKNHPHE